MEWTAERVPVITAARPSQALTALGYAHGLNRGWTTVLWRQTALGQLGRWFGPGVSSLDRHARRLGLARHARAAYRALPDSQKGRLRAYTRGLNAALHTESVRQSDPFVLLNIAPQEWAPWHTLLVERLLAWMGTPPLAAPTAAPAAVDTFCTTDRQFRRWLHLHGWSRSVAWGARPPAAPDTAAHTLFQRHVLGASALPVLQEARWHTPDGRTTTWATLPGTLLFPTGTAPRQAWASLLHSPARLTRTVVDSSRYTDWYERLAPADADEQLVHVERLAGGLPLARTTASRPPDSMRVPAPPADTVDSLTVPVPDTAWTVRWPGFSRTTDLGAWLRRGQVAAGPDTAGFTLFAADGLRTTADGDWTVLGAPPTVVTGPSAVLVGRSPWARSQAQALLHRVRTADTLAIAEWSASDSSAWAGGLLPHLEASLRASPTGGGLGNEATYLRNWDGHYDAQSIGAPLFDEWMRAYRADLGHVPTLADTSVYFGAYRQRQAFQRALRALTGRLGPDARLWRWEQRVTDRRYFPVWSADSLVHAPLRDLQSTRYAPLKRRGQGHPSALSGGPSLVDPLPVGPAPDTWAGWMRPGGPVTVRRHRYDPSRFFARSRLNAERPPPRRLTATEQGASTLLVPASNHD